MNNLVASSSNAVVIISCADFNSKGSGFFINNNGYIITNNHVVTKESIESGFLTYSYSKEIIVSFNGKLHEAILINDANDDKPIVYDYAILKINIGNTPFLEIASPTIAAHGDDILCLGFPLDFNACIATNGIISAIIQRPSHINTLHQISTVVTNAIIQFGNSGGPMIHVKSGKVIAINTFKHPLHDVLSQRLISWASHPSASAFPLIRDIIDYSLKYTYIGLNHGVSIEYSMNDPCLTGLGNSNERRH